MAHSPNTTGIGEGFCNRLATPGTPGLSVYELARRAKLEVLGVIGGITVANHGQMRTARIVTLPDLYQLAGLTPPTAKSPTPVVA